VSEALAEKKDLIEAIEERKATKSQAPQVREILFTLKDPNDDPSSIQKEYLTIENTCISNNFRNWLTSPPKQKY